MMRGITAGLALVLSCFAATASAQQPEPLTEEDKWQLIGKTWSLDQETRTRIFKYATVRRAIERIGIRRGCLIIEKVIDQTVASNEARYRNLAMQTISEVYSADEFYDDRFTFMPNGGRDSVLRRIMVRRDPAFFSQAVDEAEGAILAQLDELSPAADDWRGRFYNWRFQPRNALMYQIACSVETSSNPKERRRLWDYSYKIKD
ncbi:MAG: hypothetical protein AAGI28_08405 [Pseudomonadota bacterium]